MALSAFLERLGDVPISRDPAEIRRKSKDYFWFSPVLAEELQHLEAEVIVTPRDRADLLRVAAASAASGVPLTARGGGTGNYGQCVPLAGGAVVDLTGLARIRRLEAGAVEVEAGIAMFDLETRLRAEGQELRMFPTTWHTATLGGFVAGGTGGVGSVHWGGLREPGNLLAAEVITVEETPRVLTLKGQQCNLVNRTFGTTGLISALTIPTRAAVDWQDMLVTFAELADAIAFGQALCRAQGVEKRLVSLSCGALAGYFRPFAGQIPAGHAVVAVMVAPAGCLAVEELAAAHRGAVALQRANAAAEADPDSLPIYEIAFNHATQHVLRRARGYTYLQSLCPSAEVLLALRARLGDEVMWHVEFIGFDGGHAMNTLPVLRWGGRQRLAEVIALFEAEGAPVANPHVVTVEDGSRYKRLPGDQLGFKQAVDPAGLLNPGKMRSFKRADAA
ncbi:MAG TPA: FAD-binding oxidoreductase [Novosphingobium sp.]|nr:FAD-binding oxidoreductase [Novosphingobium sp.]